MKTFGILLLHLSVFLSHTIVSEGKIKYLGGAWNRPFKALNYTVDAFVDDLSRRVANATAEKGLNIALNPYAFKLDGTLLGVTLKGDVKFENGVVSNAGHVVRGVFAPYANRTLDLTKGYINFTVALTELDTLYDLKTDLEGIDTDSTVETTLMEIHFGYQLIHTFETKENKVIVDDVFGMAFDSAASWTIKPRYLQTYAIETLAKRDNATNTWYKRDLAMWQRDVLAPLIEEQSKGMDFPLNPY